jgi:transmembrane sensor
MKHSTIEGTHGPSAAARAEAAAWIARLHGPGRSAALEAGLRRWLAEDSDHARAFERMTEAWEAATNLSANPFPRIRVSRRAFVPRQWARAAVILLVCAMLVVGAHVWWRNPSYTTGVGEQRVVRLDDGSRVSLNSASRIVVDYRESQRRVRLMQGEAFFEVTHNPDRPFVVSAGDQQVAALGTSFSVRYESERLDVVLIEGKVAISGLPSSAAPTVRSSEQAGVATLSGALTLVPGQRLILAAAAPPRLDTPPIESVTAWRRGEVILEKTRLADAVAEMNRYEQTRLVVDDAGVADLLISGVYRTGDSTGFARAVAKMYNLSVAQEDDRIYLRRDRRTPSR